VAQLRPEQVSGTVRITTTDTILHGLVAPALKALHAQHPLLSYELHAGNELASLTRRDADIAVRATKRPPPHLVGKQVGQIRVALFAAKKGPVKRYADVEAGKALWIAPDDALPVVPSTVAVLFPVLDPDDPQAEGYLAAWYVGNAETVAQGQVIGEVFVEDTCGLVLAPAAGTIWLAARESETLCQGDVVALVE